MTIIKHKNKTIIDNLVKSSNNLNIANVIKMVKNNPVNLIVDCLNAIDDIKTIIFVLVASSHTKSKKMLLGLSFDKVEELLISARNNELRTILKGLWPDEVFQLLEDHKKLAKIILLNVDSDTRQEIQKISKYQEDEVGHIMNPEFLALNQKWTIHKCLDKIKTERLNIEQVNSLYVIDDENKLVGIVKLHDLFFAKKYSQKVLDITDVNPIFITDKGSIDEVIQMFDKYTIDTLAVCNTKNVLKGFIKNQDIVNVLKDEVTDDIYKMYGISELALPYLHAPISKIVKSRVLWLIILMISATLTSFVIDQFQILGDNLTSGLSTFLLIPLLPVLTGTSGNAGSQSSAMIIRALSLGDITNKEYSKAIGKELLVGLYIGIILAVVNFIRLIVYNAIIMNQLLPDQTNVNWSAIELYTKRVIIAAASSATLFISIVLSKCLGASLPILAIKCKIDPSVMSAPILATLLDVTSTTLLFGIGLGITFLIS